MSGGLHRWLSALWREAGRRRAPHGLVNPLRYVLPKPSARVRLHRQLWWQGLPGCPRPLWLVLQAWLWLRWVLFDAWLASARALRRHGRIVREREGVAMLSQAGRVLGLALRWSIPPVQAYAFGLYRREPADLGDQAALSYVFAAETLAWHRLVNAAEPAGSAAEATLRDKDRFARGLAEAGIATVPSLAVWRPGQGAVLRDWLQQQGVSPVLHAAGLFFKSRDGHGALGAFAAWVEQGQWQARCVDGRRVAGEPGVQALWQALCATGPVLVQSRLRSGPAVAALAVSDEVVTLRVITEREPGGRSSVCMALLEAPLGRRGLHQVWPVRAADGQVLAPPAPLVALSGTAPRLPAQGLWLPDWATVVTQSGAAHDHLGALRYVAWDWALTSDGARLLEGNAHWSLVQPQRLFGPLAARGQPIVAAHTGWPSALR